METEDGDAGAAEDAMPEAGNGGAGRTRPGGGDFGSRKVALCVDCAPNYLVSMGGPAPLGAAGGGRRPVPELQGPRSGLRASRLVGLKRHAPVAGKFVGDAELERPTARGASAPEARCWPPRCAGGRARGRARSAGGGGRRRTLPRSALQGALSVPRVKA